MGRPDRAERREAHPRPRGGTGPSRTRGSIRRRCPRRQQELPGFSQARRRRLPPEGEGRSAPAFRRSRPAREPPTLPSRFRDASTAISWQGPAKAPWRRGGRPWAGGFWPAGRFRPAQFARLAPNARVGPPVSLAPHRHRPRIRPCLRQAKAECDRWQESRHPADPRSKCDRYAPFPERERHRDRPKEAECRSNCGCYNENYSFVFRLADPQTGLTGLSRMPPSGIRL
jgi:hypothetical protein